MRNSSNLLVQLLVPYGVKMLHHRIQNDYNNDNKVGWGKMSAAGQGESDNIILKLNPVTLW